MGPGFLAAIYNFPGKKKEKRVFTDPPIVRALCPRGSGDFVDLAISAATVGKLIEARRRTDIFQAWAHLVGEMPPINNADLVRKTDYPEATITCLKDAHACFKGVKRRYDDDDDGKEIYVYVISTEYTVRWQSDMRCVMGIFPAPDTTVLTVQVKPRESLQDCQEGIWGAIVKWEFVNADRERTEFPDGCDDRYDELVWHR